MNKFFHNIRKYFKYAVRSAKAELKSEVADSYLNWLWWVIEPFCFMLIYTFVFGVVFHNKTQYFASFIFIGLTVWEFFNRMVSGSVTLIVKNRDLVTKVYLPKYILLVSKSFTYLFKTGISLVISFGLMAFQHVKFSWHILFIFPILSVLYLLAFGIGTILMNLGVTVNDLGNLTSIVLRMIFYLSGVFYNISEKLGGKLSFILLRANPVAFIMNEMRKVMLYNKLPSFEGLALWLAVSIILCFIGVHMIHKNENSYAKVI
ncbi:MAG: ABC transporter permease [Clostridia bacterium]|nr:ABC transporter permease [Clostridia bacterium]